MVGKKLMRSAAFLWVFLAACSGGGGSGNNTSDSPSTVQGTAAIGKPISLGNVVLKCATGERTATTQPDGRYRIELSGLALPCTMQVSAGAAPRQWLGDGLAVEFAR
jgi:hypothetical protein